MTTTFTASLRLEKPDFRSPDWAPAMQRNFDALDTAIRNLLMDVVPWVHGEISEVGRVKIDTDIAPASYWIANVTHTNAGAGTFAQERAANPTYWTAFSFGIQVRGAWTNDTSYVVNDIAYDSVRGVTGVCKTNHISNHVGSILDDSVDWNFIVNLPTVFTALATNYDPSASGLGVTNVQAAVDGIAALIAGAYVSSNIAYDHTASGMAAANVKAALDELKSGLVAALVTIGQNTTAITTGTIATGFMQWRPTAEVLPGWIVANALTVGNGVSGATGRANSDCAQIYDWLWNNFSNTECPVTGGRGANSAADFAAGKPIATLDMKGTQGGLGIDTMGGAATTRLTGVTAITGNGTTASSVLGENLHTNTVGELPVHIPSGSIANGTITATPSPNSFILGTPFQGHGVTGSSAVGTSDVQSISINVSQGTSTFTGNSIGSGTAANNVGRSKTGTWYIKL